MPVLGRHRFTSGLLSVGSFGVLVVALAAIDDTFRDQLVAFLSGDPSSNLALAGTDAQRLAQMVIGTVGDYGSAHTPMVVFALVAVGLLLLMLRP